MATDNLKVSELTAILGAGLAAGDLFYVVDVSAAVGSRGKSVTYAELAAIIQAGASSLPVADTTALVKGSVDATKQLRVEVDGFTAGATRVWTAPDANITVAGVNLAQTFTVPQTFTATDGASSLPISVARGAQTPFAVRVVADASQATREATVVFRDPNDSGVEGGSIGYVGALGNGYVYYSAATAHYFDGPVTMASGLVTVANRITGVSTPSGSSDAATKGYVDGLVQGLKWKASVKAATTGAGTLATSFANGQTVDGVTLSTGDRILIKDQGTATENGVYTVNASGAPTRATDADTGAELVNAACFVEQGTSNADKAFVCTSNSITLGSDNVTFVSFTSALGALLASNDLSDLASASTARTNLGLTAAATTAIGTSGATLPLLNGNNTHSGALDVTGQLTVGNGTARTVVTSGATDVTYSNAAGAGSNTAHSFSQPVSVNGRVSCTSAANTGSYLCSSFSTFVGVNAGSRVTFENGYSTVTNFMQMTAGRSRVANDVTNDTVTPAAVTGLSATLRAGRVYTGRVVLYVSNTTAADGVLVDFDGGTATWTSFRAALVSALPGSTLGTVVSAAIATDLTVTALSGTGVHCLVFEVAGVVNVAGTFIPRGAMNADTGGTVSFHADSFMHLEDTP